ncbi:MAG TPA: VOC family protein [Baekduia sp.]
MTATDESAAIPAVGTGLNHMGLAVADLEKARDFYVNVVGMEEEGLSEISSESFDKLMNDEGLRIRFWYLNLDGFRLQLVQYVDGAGESLALRHNKGGCPHLCFAVADARRKHEEIRRRGDVKIISDVVTSRYGAMVAHSFYVEDPDGMPIEFGQVEPAA